MHRLLRTTAVFNAPTETGGGAPAPVAPAAAAAPAAPPAAPVAAPAEPVAAAPAPAVSSILGDDKPVEGEKPPAEADKKADAAPAPAFAVDKIKLPEGMKSDDPALGKFGEILGNEKMSAQERGQALIDLYTELHSQARDASTKAWVDLQTQWQGEVIKELGAKLDQTKADISKAIDTLGTKDAKEFRQALGYTGAGNNPAIVRGLAKLLAPLVEGGHIPGNPGGGKLGTAALFFDNSPEFNQG